jgi:monoamine oxidase
MPSFKIDRRRFLSGTAALGVLGTLTLEPGCATPRASQPPHARPIVIVGAGFSGLVLAYRLIQRGHDVKVLEATARSGGRIRTIRGFPDGLYVEAGATHMIGDPDLVSLLKEIGMQTAPPAPRTPLATVSYVRGSRRAVPIGQDPPPDRVYTTEEERLGEEGRLMKYFAIAGEIGPAMLRSMAWSAEVAKLDAMTCADYLRSQGASPGFLADVDDMMPIGDGIEAISALEVVRVLASINYERTLIVKDARSGRIAGGSEAIPNALAARLGARIVYRTLVERIEHTEHGATLVVADPSGRHRLDAARVVLTMPFTALRTIDVAPRWSPLKARAITELGMTSVTRIWVASDRRYWLERGESGHAESDLPTGRIRDETQAQPGTAGVLGVYAPGQAGRRLAALDGNARIAALTADVARVHPAVARHIVHGDSVAWDTEPFVRGAYAAFTPGQLTTLAHAAAAPEGVVHFAGCGTSHRPGFLHGALASALRVLDEIHAATG